MLTLLLFAQAIAPTLDETIRRHVAAVQSRDLATLESTLTTGDRLDLIFPDGRRTITRREFLDFHKDWFADAGWSISFHPINTIAGPDLAVATFRSRYLDAERAGENWVTLTFRRERGGWRLVADQNTRIVTAGRPSK